MSQNFNVGPSFDFIDSKKDASRYHRKLPVVSNKIKNKHSIKNVKHNSFTMKVCDLCIRFN